MKKSILVDYDEFKEMERIVKEKTDVRVDLELRFHDYSAKTLKSYSIISAKVNENSKFDLDLQKVYEIISDSFKGLIDGYEKQLLEKEKEIQKLKSGKWNRLWKSVIGNKNENEKSNSL
jgi:hypothetical protein